jgi:branched-chain amino acid transport system ATP-binding protein
MSVLLSATSITKAFGGLKAVSNVDVVVGAGEIVSVIGPNGAGKTTFFNCLTGIYKPSGGQVQLDGETITGWAAHEVCRRGLARTFQNIRLFAEMTVLENVMVAQYAHYRPMPWDILLRTRKFLNSESKLSIEAEALLELVGLSEQSHTMARHLAYGLQRRLEIARALATRPKVLLLDEPGAGMNPSETDELMKLISLLREKGLSIVLIEHHMKVVMGISDKIIVLDQGEKIADGTPGEIRSNARVIEAYLGSSSDGEGSHA